MDLINYIKFKQSHEKYKNIESYDYTTFKVCNSFEDFYNMVNGTPVPGQIILIKDQLYLYRGRHHETGNLKFMKLERSDTYELSD